MSQPNEQGHIWVDKVQAYVCPSYLNKTKPFVIKGKYYV